MRTYLGLILCLLSTTCWANTLTLEFVQEGEPGIPRALIVIHNTFEDRSAFEEFFERWNALSWARSQYCSVYSFEYDGNGLTDLDLPSELAQDLYSRIRSNQFDRGRPDPVNPARRTTPSDPRQPDPTLKGENVEFLLGGHGFGGLVARETALLAKQDGRKVTRLAYVGTPLDGLSTVDLILGFTILERAQMTGLGRVLTLQDISRLSPSWWHLMDLFDQNATWSAYFAPASQDVIAVAAYGTASRPAHPTDNVLYGRHRKIVADEKATDGFFPQPAAWGKVTGPVPWISETALTGVNHAGLTEGSASFLIEKLVDRQVTFAYLVRRQGIEEFVRGDGDIPPIGTYWDERDVGTQPQWRNAYASPKGLYEMMWGVSP